MGKIWAFFPLYGMTQTWNEIDKLHYCLDLFANATTQAFENTDKELTAFKLMTLQNRLALNLLLAKQGGVCHMVSDFCCMFVPANDDAYGNITLALKKMHQVTRQGLEMNRVKKDGSSCILSLAGSLPTCP